MPGKLHVKKNDLLYCIIHKKISSKFIKDKRNVGFNTIKLLKTYLVEHSEIKHSNIFLIISKNNGSKNKINKWNLLKNFCKAKQ